MFLYLCRCQFPLLLLDVDVVLLAQYTAGFRKVHLLMLHDEVDGVAAFSAYKAVADILGRADHERRVLVVMEWTQPLVVDP